MRNSLTTISIKCTKKMFRWWYPTSSQYRAFLVARKMSERWKRRTRRNWRNWNQAGKMYLIMENKTIRRRCYRGEQKCSILVLVHTHVHKHIHTDMNICTHTHTLTNTRRHTLTHTLTHTHIHTHILYTHSGNSIRISILMMMNIFVRIRGNCWLK